MLRNDLRNACTLIVKIAEKWFFDLQGHVHCPGSLQNQTDKIY